MSSFRGQPFRRDHLTWLAYLMLAFLAYTQGVLAPLMPFIRQSQGLSYTLGGFLTASLAVGMIVAGLGSDRLVRRWGRRAVFWLGSAGLGASSAALGLSPWFVTTAASVLCMGACGSLTLATIQALLSDRHGERRATAFAESNVGASLAASLAPLCLGGLQQIGAGWQAALFVPAAGWLLLAARFFREPIPDSAPAARGPGVASGAGLPAAFWAYWAVICLVVSIEWCLGIWGADFLVSVAGLSTVQASTALGVFFGAMLVGRIIGSGLTRVAPVTTLLQMALAVTALGFPLFWLSRVAALNLAGLFVAGLGVANLFPFTLSVAIGLAPEQSTTASARVSLAVGTAILIAPLTLGRVADGLGLQAAYGLVAALIVIAFGVSQLARRAVRERVPAAQG